MSKHEAMDHQHYGVIMGVGLLPDFSAAHTGAALKSTVSLAAGSTLSRTAHVGAKKSRSYAPTPTAMAKL